MLCQEGTGIIVQLYKNTHCKCKTSLAHFEARSCCPKYSSSNRVSSAPTHHLSQAVSSRSCRRIPRSLAPRPRCSGYRLTFIDVLLENTPPDNGIHGEGFLHWDEGCMVWDSMYLLDLLLMNVVYQPFLLRSLVPCRSPLDPADGVLRQIAIWQANHCHKHN